MGDTVHVVFVYDPDNAPLEHERCSEVQVWPDGTEEDWYAVTEEPLATVCPLNVHEAAVPTVQEGAVYEPESVPFEQIRSWPVQLWPYGTVDDWYAVTEEPLRIV